MFVEDTTGRVLDQFDASLIPAGVLPVPGPRRAEQPISNGRESAASISGASLTGSVIWQFLYHDSQASQFRPIHSANYSVEYRLGLLGAVTGTDQGYTSLDGYVVMDCRPGERYFGLTATWGSYVRTLPQNTVGFGGQFNQDCGLTRQAVLTSDVARVYAIMSQAARDANLTFGFGRGPVVAEISSGSGSSFYTAATDRILFRSSSLPGEFGRWVIAHEYGHAYHNLAMGGLNPGASDNCNPHDLDFPSSYGCALSEGFADYFSTYITGALIGSFESNGYAINGASVNPKVEGAVAAFLLDVSDPANESHDAAEWNIAYVPRLVGTCEWRNAAGNWLRASGVDHITYCLEQSIDSFATILYAGRVVPSDWRHSATLPPTWSQAVARPLWHTNLFP